jgi:hypothetical protein
METRRSERPVFAAVVPAVSAGGHHRHAGRRLDRPAGSPRLMPRRGFAALRDQLDRASSSILLNVAEMLTRLVQRMQA